MYRLASAALDWLGDEWQPEAPLARKISAAVCPILSNQPIRYLGSAVEVLARSWCSLQSLAGSDALENILHALDLSTDPSTARHCCTVIKRMSQDLNAVDQNSADVVIASAERCLVRYMKYFKTVMAAAELIHECCHIVFNRLPSEW